MARLLQMTAPVVDLVYNVDAIPRSGQEANVTGFALTPGGGFNAMVAARIAGMEVSLGGTLGQGPFADACAAALTAHGIDIARPPLSGVDQGCCTVMLEPDGERSFVSAPGAEGVIQPADLDAIDLDAVDWVMLSGYTLHYAGSRDAVVDWVSRLPRNIMMLFDPSPVIAHLPPTLLAPVLTRTDWISANADEAAHLTGMRVPEASARTLAAPRGGAIVRNGARGCILATGGAIHDLPAHRVTPVDTNGAGDAHIGSFIAELARTGDALSAARYANVAAALSTTREGPATAPDRAQVTLFL